MSCNKLSLLHQQQLLKIARQSIEQGVNTHRPCQVSVASMDSVLQSEGCSFVTLQLHGELRGCIGALQAYQSLAEDVAEHAYAAAYRDPRFEPVNSNEIPLLNISISVLNSRP